jgi:hypothetical protein
MVATLDARPEVASNRWAFASLIFGFDYWLRRLEHVFEYSLSPRCVFRAQLDLCRRTHAFANGALLRPGDRVVNLHFWNEQVPILSNGHASLGWALQTCRAVDFSLRELARHFALHPELDDVAAIRLVVTIAPFERADQMRRILARFGFETIQNQTASWHDALRQFLENCYITLLVLARNPSAVRRDTLRRDRTEVLLLRDELERRYGVGSQPTQLRELRCR